jgi:hypothetical protein
MCVCVCVRVCACVRACVRRSWCCEGKRIVVASQPTAEIMSGAAHCVQHVLCGALCAVGPLQPHCGEYKWGGAKWWCGRRKRLLFSMSGGTHTQANKNHCFCSAPSIAEGAVCGTVGGGGRLRLVS